MRTLLVIITFFSLSACRIENIEDDDDGGGETRATPEPPRAAECIDDAACDIGEICSELGSCILPDCGDIGGEAACVSRFDCEPVYAGVDCGCGPDCACEPGQTGCVCDSFEFFRCEEV